MDIEALTKYIETVWTDERSSFDQKRNKTKYAIQQHLNQPNGSNMVLAVSGQPPNFQNVVEELLDAVDDATDSDNGCFQKDYAAQLFSIVLRDFFHAAYTSSAGDKTVGDGLNRPRKYCKDGIRLCDCMGLICSK